MNSNSVETSSAKSNPRRKEPVSAIHAKCCNINLDRLFSVHPFSSFL